MWLVYSCVFSDSEWKVEILHIKYEFSIPCLIVVKKEKVCKGKTKNKNQPDL